MTDPMWFAARVQILLTIVLQALFGLLSILTNQESKGSRLFATPAEHVAAMMKRR